MVQGESGVGFGGLGREAVDSLGTRFAAGTEVVAYCEQHCYQAGNGYSLRVMKRERHCGQ
jgi:hypothetical protein